MSLSNATDLDGNISSSPTNTTFLIDTNTEVGLSVDLSYIANPAPVGIQRIFAEYSRQITGIPNISIDQQGATDIASTPMNAPASTWTASTGVETNTWTSVAYGNNIFVGVSVEGKVMSSPDGVVWTEGVASSSSPWTSIAYGNGIFIAVAQSGSAMTSPDGITWTERTPVSYFQWSSVTYGNGMFVAVSSDGTNRVMTSPNGITWIERVATEQNSWSSVTYGGGTFVAVSYDGINQVMTSTDGIDWELQTGPVLSSWTSVTYGNDLFVAVSYDEKIMTSPDGITWTERTVGETNHWQSVVFGNNLFVAISSNGTHRVTTSPDGINWTLKTSANSNALQSITYGKGIFVALASNGTNQIMVSPDRYYYDYEVFKKDGTNYIDGIATVAITTVTDLLGVISNNPTNNTFTIKTDAAISGILTSSVFDTTSTANSTYIKYNSIMWKGVLGGEAVPPNEGKVRFQLATSSDPVGPWNYYGGDTCQIGDWFNTTGPDSPVELKGSSCISSWNGKEYFKYRVQICSNDCITSGPNTPTVNSVIVNWSP